MIETSEEEVHATMVSGELPSIMEPSESPVSANPAADEGIDNHAEEPRVDAGIIPPVARSGKKPFHEEQQRADEGGPSLQERGKRKAGGNAIGNSHSSGRSDPEEKCSEVPTCRHVSFSNYTERTGK